MAKRVTAYFLSYLSLVGCFLERVLQKTIA
ncbi:hypothetical protein C1752_03525 [Acaryochloris thomasi RCC1774]|uniref:Uncharacterized protein n=1 Tax=Acaryochloris thomasi RCC1774 TaxID=1764569 RepID=A0A2W1JGI9_9CYAN|nr:hypothetical protein C1752_03525 [Acaryochloris thomasi RCC1774]